MQRRIAAKALEKVIGEIVHTPANDPAPRQGNKAPARLRRLTDADLRLRVAR